MYNIKQRVPIYILIAIMTLLQLAWLFGTWVTGASTNWQKILAVGVYSTLAGFLAALLPEQWICWLVEIKDRLVRKEKTYLILISAILIIVGFVYALNQRVWTDEQENLRASTIVATQGPGELFLRYGEIGWLMRHHPPLMPIINGLAMRLLGVSMLSMRLVSLLFCLGAILVTYFFSRELYDRETALISTTVLLTFPLVIRLGTAGMMDVQLLFFFMLGLFFVLRLSQKPNVLLAIFIGLTIGVGLVTKYIMAFIFPVLGILYLLFPYVRKIPFHLGLATLVSGAILGIWLFYSRSFGIAAVQEKAFPINPSYFVSNSGGFRWMMNSLLTRLPSAIGVFNIPLIVLGGGLVLRRHERRDLFLLSWVAIISLILIVTLPDHRYFMPTFPALAILIAHWLKTRPILLGRAVLLQVMLAGGALFFLMDWNRAAEMFVR